MMLNVRNLRLRRADSVVRLFGTHSNIAAVSAANLIVRYVGVTAAARSGKVTGRFAVQHAITAQTLPSIIHDRLTAIRIGPEHQVGDLSVATYLAGLVIGFLGAARVIFPVDERLAAASGVFAVRLLDDGVLAALVGLVVVDASCAAR